MDKKETTRLLNNLLEYNRVDINNLKSVFPDVGDAFMNVILAIDEEYGSGNIDKTLLTTPPLQTLVYDNTQPLTTIEIGTQEWCIENLEVVTYRNGDIIPEVTGDKEWENLTTGAWCYYKNNLTNGTTFGKLYNWFAVNDPRGLAPTGYHIPTNNEWTILTDYLGGNLEGKKMKSSSGWENNGGGTNSSGFTGLPGGYRSSNGYFSFIGANGYWWSSSEFNTNNAWYRYLYYNNGNVNSFNYYKRNGFSVRCLRDNIQTSVTNNQTQNVAFKVGDEFQQNNRGTVYVISAIIANRVDISWTDSNGKQSASYDIKDVITYFNDKSWILVDKNIPTTINFITNWRPEWKAMGLRPSPTRKASLENDDALGLGNDGIIYAIATDKNGTKKWKKTSYTSFNKNNRDEFSQVYDRNMLIDQLNYENSQLDKTDVDYKDNEKLIKQVLTEIQ